MADGASRTARASGMVNPRQRGSVARMMRPSLSVTATASEMPAQDRSSRDRSAPTTITPNVLPSATTARE